jgi:hypothetical protein
MDAMAEAFDAIIQRALKEVSIASILEDALAIITASDEMRNRARAVLSLLSSHRS